MNRDSLFINIILNFLYLYMILYNKYIVSLALSIRTNDSDTTTGWNGYLAGYQGKMTKENLQTSYNILYYNIL